MTKDSTNPISRLLNRMQVKAVIFDLDGTMIDNNAFHLQTWKRYLEKNKIDISEEAYRMHINGRTNKDALDYIYGRNLADDEALIYTREKEALYREIYAPHIKPVAGLTELLEILQEKNIPMAIATSGIPENIEFMFSHIPVRHYFNEIVHSGHIQKGKPDPEIYLKTASSLGIHPNDCLAFEDAAVGVRSAKSAGMRVIALTTTQPAEELTDADLVIADFLPDSFTAAGI